MQEKSPLLTRRFAVLFAAGLAGSIALSGCQTAPGAPQPPAAYTFQAERSAVVDAIVATFAADGFTLAAQSDNLLVMRYGEAEARFVVTGDDPVTVAATSGMAGPGGITAGLSFEENAKRAMMDKRMERVRVLLDA